MSGLSVWLALLILACSVGQAGAQTPALPPHALPARAPATPPQEATVPAVSSNAQRIYERLRSRLVQVRTLLKTQDSQSSVGSAFLVSDEGHLITNYHVVSEFALAPKDHRLVYTTADGQQGALQLLAVDVTHDLALVKPVDADALNGRGAIPFRAGEPGRGARMLSLGNPLDVGFAINEGAYNGLVERSFVPIIFFGGSLSPGMSGGPAVDDTGALIGVNVATRIDGEQVAFVVPSRFAEALLSRGRHAAAVTQPLHEEIARQVLIHQQALTDAFIALPWRSAGNAHYRIPVPREDFMRCWGRGSKEKDPGLRFERSDCVMMHSGLFIHRGLSLGQINVRHEAYDGTHLGALRFAHQYARSFANEDFGQRSAQMTGPRCQERTLRTADGLPMRTVLCMSAYKKLPGLYRLSVLTTSLDQSTAGAQGRFDAEGFSYDNAMRLARHYLSGFGTMAPVR